MLIWEALTAIGDLLFGAFLALSWLFLAASAVVFGVVMLGGRLSITGPARGPSRSPFCDKCRAPLDISVLTFPAGAQIEWDNKHKCEGEQRGGSTK